MKLYLLERISEVDYDEKCGFVIRAGTKRDARILANSKHSDEGAIWEDENKTTCNRIFERGKREVILVDFNAG